MSTQDTPADQGPEETASTPRLPDNPPVRGPDAEESDQGDGRHGWHDADGTPYPGDPEPAGARPEGPRPADEAP